MASEAFHADGEGVMDVPERDRDLVRILVERRASGESYEEIAKYVPRSISTLRRWGREFWIEIEDMKLGRN